MPDQHFTGSWRDDHCIIERPTASTLADSFIELEADQSIERLDQLERIGNSLDHDRRPKIFGTTGRGTLLCTGASKANSERRRHFTSKVAQGLARSCFNTQDFPP